MTGTEILSIGIVGKSLRDTLIDIDDNPSYSISSLKNCTLQNIKKTTI